MSTSAEFKRDIMSFSTGLYHIKNRSPVGLLGTTSIPDRRAAQCTRQRTQTLYPSTWPGRDQQFPALRHHRQMVHQPTTKNEVNGATFTGPILDRGLVHGTGSLAEQ